MPDILFQDGKQYHIEPPDRAFEFQDNGDRWGNTMIRFDHNALTVEEILEQIAPQHLEHTIAVQLNDTAENPCAPNESEPPDLETVRMFRASPPKSSVWAALPTATMLQLAGTMLPPEKSALP